MTVISPTNWESPVKDPILSFLCMLGYSIYFISTIIIFLHNYKHLAKLTKHLLKKIICWQLTIVNIEDKYTLERNIERNIYYIA